VLAVSVMRKAIRLLYTALRGAVAEGIVVDLLVSRGRQNRYNRPRGHVDFTTESGEKVRFREFRPMYHPVGSVVRVRYSRRKPKWATISPPLDYIQLILSGCLGLFAFGIMLGTAVWQLFWV
jgi:hypothetical protein